jgi:hypothetical protein
VRGYLSYLEYAWRYQRWRLCVWVAGVVMIFIGGPRLAGSNGFFAGGLLIVLAVAPWPWGAEAYRSRLRRASNRASRLTRAAQQRWFAGERERLSQLRDRAAPVTLAADAGELAHVLEEAIERGQGPGEFAARAVELLQMRVRWDELRERIAAAASNPAEQCYGAAVAALVSERECDREELHAQVARALYELVVDQQRSRPPARLRGEHERLQAVMHEERAALAAYQSASRGQDAAAVYEAAAAYERAVGARADALRAIVLWPARSRAKSAADTEQPHGSPG